jgi:hypothetical protein
MQHWALDKAFAGCASVVNVTAMQRAYLCIAGTKVIWLIYRGISLQEVQLFTDAGGKFLVSEHMKARYTELCWLPLDIRSKTRKETASEKLFSPPA